jgi:pyrroloquinoline quinone (PQQ) biosynthesis protein C
MNSSMSFAESLEVLFRQENECFLAEVPRASHLTDSGALDLAYYLRHRIETIKRIRMTARTDALSLAAMLTEDYDAARVWARYICEELDHDRMFYDDLEHHGLTRETVDATAPLPATVALGDYLERRIRDNGSLCAVAYSVFVEWNSERYSRPAVAKARATFGPAATEGSFSHLAVDEEEDHAETMIALADQLTQTPERRAIFLADLAEIARLFRRYFRELHDAADHDLAALKVESLAFA